jgi:multidrug resistance efflux pump
METSTEVKKEGIFKKPWVQSLFGIILIILIAGGLLVYKMLSSRVSIDNSVISAPIIDIGPQAEGIIEQVYVQPGDHVAAGQTLARVGAEVLTVQVAGIIINTNDAPGEVFQPMVSSPIVQMIDPTALRVVGSIKENEGLSKVVVGDPVSFTVDAFAGQTFTGVVDSIAPTSKSSEVVFNISDQREEKEFDVKVKYDISANPQFKNGMSAKILIYPKK